MALLQRIHLKPQIPFSCSLSTTNSAYLKSFNINYLDILEKYIAKFSQVVKIIIARDLNTALVFCEIFIEDDEGKYLPPADDYEIDSNILTRNNLAKGCHIKSIN